MDLSNPFMSNTPTSSPVKGRGSASSRRSGRVERLQGSPTRPPRRSRNPGAVVYSDRFLPQRTEISLPAIQAIGSESGGEGFAGRAGLARGGSVDTENQVEWQRERTAHETFDTVLKNEIFGEMLARGAVGRETSIDRIRNTTSSSGSRAGSDSRSGSPLRSSDTEGYSPLRSGSSTHHSSDTELHSAPVTPRKLFASDPHIQGTTNSPRGATLLSYSQRSSARRPSTASLLQSQFIDPVSPVRPETKQLLLSPRKQVRRIAKVPYRVLDAPSLADDFYYDLIDWSATDMLAVALGKSIFLTNNTTGEVFHLCETANEYTSLSWVAAGTHLAVGQGNGIVEIYDVAKKKCIRTLTGHLDRATCLSWNNYVLSSGSRDRTILHRDVRMPEPYFERLQTHTQEVCGLKWNVDENKLASGGNDNIVNVYDGTAAQPTLTLTEHTAAVKAMAWSPHKRSTLATGGGTADKKLKVWNISNSTRISDTDTGSQICNMIWSRNTDEIVTSHGYSKYNLTLWDFPSMDPIAILKGHSFRVLHLTLSADGTTVVSGAGDETLRYWRLFDKPKHRIPTSSSVMFNSMNRIR